MRTRLIPAEGANHAHINPPSTHSRCVHLECDEVEVGPPGTSGSAAPACQQTKVCVGDAHDCRKQPADGVHHAEEILPSPLTAKPLWQ